MVKISFQLQKRLKNDPKISIFKNFQLTSKMFLDIVGVITTSKSILNSFQEGAPGAPTPCQVGLIEIDIKSLIAVKVDVPISDSVIIALV